jgi:hypothetical protein
MSKMSQDAINVGLFDEVKRLQGELNTHREFEGRLVKVLYNEMSIPKEYFSNDSSRYRSEEERLEKLRDYLLNV